MKGTVAQVALQGATFAFDKLYSYAVPNNIIVTAGCRVLVPFGKGNIKKQGMVFNVSFNETNKLKSIISAIDKTPILNDESLKMCEFLHESVFCTYYDAINSILPLGVSHKLINF